MAVTNSFAPNTIIKSSEVNENFDSLVDGRAFVYERQGGSATDWDTSGTTDYNISDFKIQCGTNTTDGGTSVVTVTFPTAFAYKPIVLTTLVNTVSGTAFIVDNVAVGSFRGNAQGAGARKFFWIAIGPI